MTTQDPFKLDRRRVRRSFDRASDSYDRAAVLQKQVRLELLQRLDLVRLEPAVIVDLGSGPRNGSAPAPGNPGPGVPAPGGTAQPRFPANVMPTPLQPYASTIGGVN